LDHLHKFLVLESNLLKNYHLNNMRKKVVFYLALVCLLSAFQCDDEYVPDEVVENLNLVKIEDNKTVFSVGDYLFISTSINNEQITTDGKTILIRDYMFADESDLFFDLEISKIASTGEETSYFVSDTDVIEGAIFTQDQGRFFNISSAYNEAAASFSSEIGIKLSETGSYALKTSTIKDNIHIISFDTQSSSGSEFIIAIEPLQHIFFPHSITLILGNNSSFHGKI